MKSIIKKRRKKDYSKTYFRSLMVFYFYANKGALNVFCKIGRIQYISPITPIQIQLQFRLFGRLIAYIHILTLMLQHTKSLSFDINANVQDQHPVR